MVQNWDSLFGSSGDNENLGFGVLGKVVDGELLVDESIRNSIPTILAVLRLSTILKNLQKIQYL